MAETGKGGRGPGMNVDTKLVRELAKLLSETGLTEIEVQDGERRIKVGDKVKAGQTLLIIEAMKVMNPIAATADGTVQQILIENAQPVEFDQPLVVVA